MVLVGAEVPVLGRDLLDERAVPAPDPFEEGRRVDPLLVHLVVEVVDARHHVGADGADDPIGVGGLPRLEKGDVDEGAVAEAVEVPAPGPRRALAHVGHGFSHRNPARRDGEHEPVPVLAGEPHRARPEPRYVEGDPGLEVHVLELVHQHPDRSADPVELVVHHLAGEERPEHPQVLGVFADPHRALAHAAHRGVAGPDREVDPPRREAVQGRHRGDVHGRDPGAADRDAGSEAKAHGLPGGEGEHRVAVGEQHLAVRRPYRVVAEVLGVGVEADLVDVGHDAYSELHARPPRVRARFYRLCVWRGGGRRMRAGRGRRRPCRFAKAVSRCGGAASA